MVHKISAKIIACAIKNEYIKQELFEEYLYALEIILNILIADITMLIIGFAAGMLWECVMFWLVYKILRKYCGGYHFETSLKCYLSSCIMCIVALAVARYVPYNILVWSVITLSATIILFIISPVEAANKPLDEKEQKIFGRVARFLIIIFSVCLCVVITIFHQYSLSKVIALAMISVALLSVVGKIYLSVRKN